MERGQSAVLQAEALAPEALGERLSGLERTVLAIGDGAVEFRAQLERSGALVPDERAELHRVTAVAHCRIARQLEAGDPDRIVPHYLRAPDVKEPPARRVRDKQ